MSYEQWITNRVVADPDAELDPDSARADYVAYCSDLGITKQPRSKQRAAARAAGGKPKGTGRALRYLGIRLTGPLWDSGYRAGGGHVPPPAVDPLPALQALHAAGLITDRTALNRAWKDLGA